MVLMLQIIIMVTDIARNNLIKLLLVYNFIRRPRIILFIKYFWISRTYSIQAYGWMFFLAIKFGTLLGILALAMQRLKGNYERYRQRLEAIKKSGFFDRECEEIAQFYNIKLRRDRLESDQIGDDFADVFPVARVGLADGDALGIELDGLEVGEVDGRRRPLHVDAGGAACIGIQ